MPDPNSFDLNNQPRAADTVPQIPTSVSEVDIRTLASDLDQMGRSGGLAGAAAPSAPAPTPSAAPAPAASDDRSAETTRDTEGSAQPEEEEPVARPGLMRAVIITIVAILAAAGLFALGYFVLG